jgi:hypothetical protein
VSDLPFYDLPAHAFPFTIEYIDDDTGEVLERVDVEGPGVTYIPSFPGRFVAVRIVGAGGWDHTTLPDRT